MVLIRSEIWVMILICSCYDLDVVWVMILTWFWNVVDMILIWFDMAWERSSLFRVPNGLA